MHESRSEHVFRASEDRNYFRRLLRGANRVIADAHDQVDSLFDNFGSVASGSDGAPRRYGPDLQALTGKGGNAHGSGPIDKRGSARAGVLSCRLTQPFAATLQPLSTRLRTR